MPSPIADVDALLLLQAGPRTLPRVRIQGTAFVTDAGRFRWRGVSAFPLAYFMATGQADRAEAFIAWAASRGVTVLRVLTMARWMFTLTPAQGLDAMLAVLTLAHRYGVYVEVVGIADSASYTFDHSAHIRELGALCAAHPACLGLELANEPKHHTQDDWVQEPGFLVELADLVPRTVNVALGAAHGSDDESMAFIGGDYVTVHADRAPGDLGWRWVRHAREIQANRDGYHHKPAVSDEPERSDLARDKHLAMGVLMAMWNVGDTVHLASLRDGQIPTGAELAAFDARTQGWALVGECVGRYSRASLMGDPVASVSDADAVRIYSAIDGNRALVLGLGVQREDSIIWRPGWARRLVHGEGQMRLWETTKEQ